MSLLPKPPNALKILTIDGGGLRAIASLLIIDNLLETIKQENKAQEKPRPCEVFDMIGGIGAGGWLALLLGRFCLDIPTCLLEWSKLMGTVAPYSTLQSEKRRLFTDSLFDQDRLAAQVKELTELYATGPNLVDEDLVDRIRSRYVFVAARREDKKHEYNLFRSYSLPKASKSEGSRLLPGPSRPDEFPMVRAFAVTGAAKYFSGHVKEDIAGKGRRRFLDRTSPQPHNVTELALNEAWGLFGTDVAMDVVVNVGPGVISERDFRNISGTLHRSFSWGLSSEAKQQQKKPRADPLKPSSVPTGMAPARTNTVGSVSDITPARKAARTEDEIERAIKRKLARVYGNGNAPPYYRLAPPASVDGSYQNDTRRVKSTSEAIDNYLTFDSSRSIMRMLKPRWVGEYPRMAPV